MGRESEWDTARTPGTEVDALREENARLRGLLEASVKAEHFPDRDPKKARFALCVPCTERRNALAGVLWPCEPYQEGMAALRGGK